MGGDGDPASWPGAWARYQRAMKAAGRAPGTIRLHHHYVSMLWERHPRPWAVTAEDLLEVLARDGWAPETRKSARSALRAFYKWGFGSGHVAEDPSFGLPPVTVPAGVPRPTPEHLVRRLLQIDDRIGFMAMLAAYEGLRAGEIARVHADDVLGDELTVHGKGGKVRVLPVISPILLTRLHRVQGWAFPNGYGSHLTPGHVTKLLSDAMPEGWTAHTLRHRFATVTYAATRDLLAVGGLLGHTRPETTQRYVQLPDDALRVAAAAAVLV